MNKIANWVFGSFFRTIGRIIAFVVIGGLVAYAISTSSLKLPNIEDLLGIMKVNASSFYQETIDWKDSSGNSLPQYYGQYYQYNYFTSYKDKEYYTSATIPNHARGVIITANFRGLQTGIDYECTRINDDYDGGGSTAWCDTLSQTDGTNATFKIKYNGQQNVTSCYYLGSESTMLSNSYGQMSVMLYCPLPSNINNKNINSLLYTGSFSSSYYYTSDYYYIGLEKTLLFDIDDTGEIVASQEQMTQDIISSQNQTTQDIINSQEQQTQDTINSQKVCQKIDKVNISKDNYYLYDNGQEVSSTGYGITDFIKIDGATIKTTKTFTISASASAYCFYNINKELISCKFNRTLTTESELTIPSGSSYVKFSIQKQNNMPQFEICKNGNQAVTDTINDDDVGEAENSAEDFFNDFEVTDHGGLTSIITAPLNTIQGLLSNTCTPLVLPLPFVNENLTLPCLSDIYSQHFGAFFTIYQGIMLAIISYRCLKSLLFDIKGFTNPDDDRIEVVDL